MTILITDVLYLLAETVTPPVVLNSLSSVPCSSLYPAKPHNRSNGENVDIPWIYYYSFVASQLINVNHVPGVITDVSVAAFLTLMIAGCLLIL